jgi:hypothetical protein
MKTLIIYMKSLIIGAAVLTFAGSATNAGIVGTTVTIEYLFSTVLGSSVLPITTNPTTLTCAPLGAGICSDFPEDAVFTITDNSFTVSEDAGSAYIASGFNGIGYVDFGIDITGVTLSTNLPGLTAADVSFGPHSVEYNAEGLSFKAAPYFITLTVATVPVPELSTWTMLALGFFGLAFAGYWTSRRSAGIAK